MGADFPPWLALEMGDVLPRKVIDRFGRWVETAMNDAELTMPPGSLDTDDSPICPICDAADLSCEHVALTFVPGDSIGGGAAYTEAHAFLAALDDALVESATRRAVRIKGACRALCLEAAKLARRREDRVNPGDVPSELDLERWELLEDVLSRVPGVEVRDYEVGYGGFGAEDSGRVVYAFRVARVVEKLREEIEVLGAP